MNDGAGARGEGQRRVGGPVWPWVLLALLCALAGGSAGFFLTRPIYRSTAELINDGDGPELELVGPVVRAPSCIEQAMADPVWRALGRPVTPRGTSAFRNSIGVKRESKLIVTVTFDDPDPKAAQASLVALVQAWRQMSEGMRGGAEQRRMSILNERMNSLVVDLAAKNNRIHAITNAWDAVDIDDVWKARVDELMRLKRLSDDAEFAELTRPAASRPTTVPAALAALKERYKRESDEFLTLRRARAQLNELRPEAKELQQQVSSLRAEIDGENLRLRLADEVRILSYGDLPGIPAIDARPWHATLGAAAGLGVFALIAIARRWRGRRAGAFPMATAGVEVEPAPV